ncbi:MAG: RNA polymerase sigma factor [Actinomycetota bacterium]|nr:RNA polymerase sigma factor [Actinomycetota bacterium]
MAGTTRSGDPRADLLALYDESVPHVYGYVLARCRNRATAEEVTSDVFLGAVDNVRRGVVGEVTTAWLIGIARHKLVDHWRRTGGEQRRLAAVAADPTLTAGVGVDDWDVQLDALAARDVLDHLGAHHRAALTLRYLDDLPVAAVADVLGRTLHATEALLVRARRAFRVVYEAHSGNPEEVQP